MKRLPVLLLSSFVFALSGCASSAYNDAVASGDGAIEAGDYETALESYSIALTEEETEAAQAVYALLQKVQEAGEALAAGEFENSIAAYESVVKADSEGNEIIETIQADAAALLEESKAANAAYISMTGKLAEGKASMEDKQFDEAIELFEAAAGEETFTVPALVVLQEEAVKLSEQAAKEKEIYAVHQTLKEQLKEGKTLLEEQKFDKAINLFDAVSSSKNETDNAQTTEILEEAETLRQEAVAAKQEYEKQNNGSGEVSHEEARELVLQHLGYEDSSALNGPDVFLKHSYDTEEGSYVYRLYEVVVENPETEAGHMVTWAFYTVDPETKEVQENQ